MANTSGQDEKWDLVKKEMMNTIEMLEKSEKLTNDGRLFIVYYVFPYII